MAQVSLYDPSMLVWLDESGCDSRNTIRKYAYSMRGMTRDYLLGAKDTLPFPLCPLKVYMMFFWLRVL